MFRPEQVGTRKRYTYARAQEVLKMPHLLDLQTKSYAWFQKEGLKDVFNDISPIEDNAKKWSLYLGNYYFGEKKYSIEECKERDATYSAPLQVHLSSMVQNVSSYLSSSVPLAFISNANRILTAR